MLKNKLKSFRHLKEMNQTEFAAFLGVQQAQFSRWERQVQQPNLEWAYKLCVKLNCNITDLFYESPE
ncbi:helix-turn-helix transcriptional regulator [Anaerospora hongkongensis]|uniref:helix-turn-helix transcriptional regulator n=1 Tax=Anaerospora hongkongensis TaxID=244830 RepID=UPI003A523661